MSQTRTIDEHFNRDERWNRRSVYIQASTGQLFGSTPPADPWTRIWYAAEAHDAKSGDWREFVGCRRIGVWARGSLVYWRRRDLFGCVVRGEIRGECLVKLDWPYDPKLPPVLAPARELTDASEHR